MSDEFEKYDLSKRDRLMLKRLDDIHEELIKVNENLIKMLGARPSPS